jgi:hypothetical protein
MPIPDAASAIGVGPTTMYGLIKNNEVETILVGKRRVVLTESLCAYIERKRTAGYQPRRVPWDPPDPTIRARRLRQTKIKGTNHRRRLTSSAVSG